MTPKRTAKAKVKALATMREVYGDKAVVRDEPLKLYDYGPCQVGRLSDRTPGMFVLVGQGKTWKEALADAGRR